MLKISDFSRLVQVSTKTLRHYDRIGLLEPARVDTFTGYRYYSMEQLARLNRILALKALGLSLGEIKHLLDGSLTTEQIRGMFLLKQAEVRQRVVEDQQRLAYVESKLRQIEQEGKMSDYEVIVKALPAALVASVRTTAPNQEALNPTLVAAFDTVTTYIRTHGAQVSKDPMLCGVTIYHDMEWNPHGPIDVEALFGVEGELAGSERVQVYELQEVPQMATAVHRGPFSTLPNAHQAIARWVTEHHYEVCGPNREVNLQYDPKGDPNLYVTEVQYPVRKAQP